VAKKTAMPDPTAFDLEGEGDAIPLFPETDAEREKRESFYDTTPARSDEHFDVFTHSISLKGALPLKEKLNNCAAVTVTFADADGQIIASGVADISVGFAPHFTKEANIMERAHKAKLR
jgi:hypothetical protein